MTELNVTLDNLPILECLGSETRVRMIEMLREQPMNIKDMARALSISSAIVTKHVQKLEECGIIRTENLAGKRGIQKRCTLAIERMTLLFRNEGDEASSNPDRLTVSIPVGQYTAFDVKPTCGLASHEKLIGMLDDPRYFADTEHVKADHIWFGSGYVEYRIPNYLLASQRLKTIRISLEICSEAPAYREDWPSDITFSLNGTPVLTWTCPGDFGGTRGLYTPAWWPLSSTQHGLLKTVTVSEDGSYIDGVRMSDVTVTDLGIAPRKEITLRIASPADARHPGGVSLFGRRFGNYDQDIEVMLEYGD